MKIYLVGGAVRDKLLGKKVKERDYVVVGGTPKEMLKRGFKQVGKGFPVFLHPKTHAEYALARTERKTGKGYTAFSCYSAPDVTLEEDLKRRDLTINAMAKDERGKIIDPFGGKRDLKKKILRHVSEAFAEDPLRVLRVARFAARFPNFKVAQETQKLMRAIVKAGEIEALVIERVWLELERALKEKAPWRFFEVVAGSRAHKILFPELKIKNGVLNLKKALLLTTDPITLFAATFVNLSVAKARSLTNRLKPPRLYREFLLLLIKNRRAINQANKLSAAKVLALLSRTDSFRKPERFKQMLTAYAASNPKNAPKICHFWQKALQTTSKVNIKTLLKQNLAPQEFKHALIKLRLKKLESLN